MEKDKREAGKDWRRAGLIDLSLDTLERTRADLAEMTKRYMAGEIADTPFRAFVYATNSITKLLVHAKASELEKRIASLEKAAGRSH